MSGVVAIALIILIAIPLAFFGIESIFMTQRVVDLGEVNGEVITQLDFDRAIAVRNNQIMSSLGENYSPDLLDTERVRQAALNDLVVAKLYLSEAEKQDMSVSDAQISSSVLTNPGFQLDGGFSETMFRNYLANMGYTSAEFMDSYREDLTSRQLTAGLLSSGFGTDMLVQNIVAVSQEERSYEYIQLPVESVLDQVEVTEEQIQAFYDENTDMFEQPEMISVNYVRLSRDQFLDEVEVSEEEVMERFEILQSQQPTRYEVAHILVEESDESADKLDRIQARLAAGESFETIAQDLSEDIGSAENGGYLGYTDGNTFPVAFEETVTELEVEQVSGPVQTDAGFH
ncbi:MAG: SurA N-terminal domain-containing protein, partial [Pseudomonadales bacterium]